MPRPRIHAAPRPIVFTLLAILASPPGLLGEDHSLERIGCLELPEIQSEKQAENLSGAALSGDGRLLVLATDEKSQLLVVRTDVAEIEPIELGIRADKDEIDFEGVALHDGGTTFVALGSHSAKRKNIYREKDADKSLADLRVRFEGESPQAEPDRDRLVLVELDPATGRMIGSAREPRFAPGERTLRQVIEEHEVLGPFGALPSKENGVDIEGIASDGEKIYLGFRGPVLRFGLVPVLVVAPDGQVEPELRYVQLDGRGIRDIARVAGGFLIVAGPVGDSPLSYQLYFWNGSTLFPGVRGPGEPAVGTVELLGEIPTPPGGKAEALAILAEYPAVPLIGYEGAWVLLVLFDGPAGGAPACFRLDRPRSRRP